MTDKNNIEEKLQNLGNAIGSDDKFVENVISRIDAKPTSNLSKTKSQNIWSNIMKSPISKLAAVAVIIIAVIIGISNLQLTSPVYGISDVSEILRNSQTVHLKGWRCANVQLGLYDPDIVKPGQKETRALLEYWIDIETGAFRTSEPGSVIVEGNKFRTMNFISIYDGEFLMEFNSENKTVRFTKYSPYQQLIRKKKNIALTLDSLVPILDSSNKYKIIGKENIGDLEYNIWQFEYAEPSFGQDQYRVKVWVCPYNGRLGKMELWMKNEGIDWFHDMEINQIEYNKSIPGNTFNTEIPEDYSSEYTKENAPVKELFQNAIYHFYEQVGKLVSQRLTSHACFTLNDGSVILGWSCVFNEEGSEEIIPDADGYQEEIFTNLIVGGQLPELPIVFYNVSPINEKPDVEYIARHLTYTRKSDAFYEWSIYVPDMSLDKYYGTLDYNTHYKNNIDDTKGATTLGEIGDIQIENKSEFNTFVLGAMAELSDDGKAPVGVTYEKVLRLAQQIRESSAN